MSYRFVVTIYLDSQYEETLSPVLELIASEALVFECPFREKPPYDSRFCLYYDSEEKALQVKDTLQPILQDMGIDLALAVDILEDTDWQNEWKKYFKPMKIGDRLSILPAWDRDRQASVPEAVYIDPGMAFGSGSHATTKGCLLFLEKLIYPGMNVLDFGTGSGILAIAACKLGAAHVDAIDNDPQAIEVARRNCEENDCFAQVELLVGDSQIIPNANYELIIANITADIIIEHFLRLLAGQTKLKFIILSGISEQRKPELDAFLTGKGRLPSEVWQENSWYTYLILV